MRCTLRAFVLGLSLLTALPAGAADLIGSVEDVYAVRHLRRTLFDPRAALDLAPEESRFLEDFFALTDEAVLLNTNVGRWFFTSGAKGIHAADYLDRMDALRARLDVLATPERVRAVRDLVAESLQLQRGFMAERHDALEAGRPFESQLTDQFAYHEGLHRSQRMLLKAFAELHALFPNAGETTHMAFHDHLRAMDLK
ncbi:MAG: hypothetical protein O7A71_06490 [Chloroflexi bacterium]|nr:hypothetical protein [Chloroflexota bacterium]